ncbi:uncharacterized protein LOC105250461 [Camponotus floridanus]|uniref:uncharacterized protein LOC105250461 n=1 Tax=Camponotus floridanus TaxID=104421 RepID=UPI000DC686A9|nr:uncharacterized protein LOC105250461 [Camponotus floridanus]
MAVMRTTSMLRSDCGVSDDGRGSRRCNPRTGTRAGGRRVSKESFSVESGSVAAKSGGSGKFLLVGAVLAIQFVGAAAISSKAGNIQVDFKMPKEATVGSSIDLRCEWRISGGDLYSVKWYKDDHEFFRFLPDSAQRTQIFPRPGVKVETRPNNEKKSIKLKDLVLESSGQYKCEVSTEAPSFATTYQTANLTVILPPDNGPEITGLSLHYAIGENVTAKCISWPSMPKANLHWTINDDPVPLENTIQYAPMAPTNSGAIPNTLGLSLETEQRHFKGDGKLVKIKCIAEVGSRKYETERMVHMAYVNNQRLSAGDMHAAARSIRTDLLAKLLTAILALVLLTT